MYIPRNIILEELTKTDVNDQLSKFISTKDFKTKIQNIIMDKLKDNKELEDKMFEITRIAITQFYKTIWEKRSMFASIKKK